MLKRDDEGEKTTWSRFEKTKEENLQKKRREGMQLQALLQPIFGPAVKKMLARLPAMVVGVYSEDVSLQLEDATQFSDLLSIGSPPIEEVIQAGVVPRFVEFLMREDFLQLQFEAAWALTNIASGTSENTQIVIDHGAVPIFVKLLSSQSDDVREQTRPALPPLERLIHSNDEEVLTHACWALAYLSDGTNDKIQSVIDAGVCPRLVELLLHPSPSVIISALRTVGNIVAGDDVRTQVLVDLQALPRLVQLLTSNHKNIIMKDACWTISNIMAGNKEQIQAVIDAGIIGPLIQLLQNAEFDIKKEAAWAVSNATFRGAHDQIKFLVNQGCIKPLCDLLVCPDPRIVTVCLEELENILKVGKADKNSGRTGGVNLYAQIIDEAEGLEKIENLQSHDNTEIYEKVVKMLETYWLEEDDEGMPTEDAAQNGFRFGGNGQFPVPSGGFNFS